MLALFASQHVNKWIKALLEYSNNFNNKFKFYIPLIYDRYIFYVNSKASEYVEINNSCQLLTIVVPTGHANYNHFTVPL